MGDLHGEKNIDKPDGFHALLRHSVTRNCSFGVNARV